MGIDDHIRFSRDGAALDVDDGKRSGAALLGEVQHCLAVGGLAALADDDDQVVAVQHRIAVAELAGDIDRHGYARELFDHILADHAGMHGGTAGNDKDTLQSPQHPEGDPALG